MMLRMMSPKRSIHKGDSNQECMQWWRSRTADGLRSSLASPKTPPDRNVCAHGWFCVRGPSTAIARIRAPGMVRSSRGSKRTLHAGSRVSWCRGAGAEPSARNSWV